jgi:hypothetical protein
LEIQYSDVGEINAEQYYNETYGDKWKLTLTWANLYNAQQT